MSAGKFWSQGSFAPGGAAPPSPSWRLVTYDEYLAGSQRVDTDGTATWSAGPPASEYATVRYTYTKGAGDRAEEYFFVPLPWAVSSAGVGDVYGEVLETSPAAEDPKSAYFLALGVADSASTDAIMGGIYSGGAASGANFARSYYLSVDVTSLTPGAGGYPYQQRNGTFQRAVGIRGFLGSASVAQSVVTWAAEGGGAGVDQAPTLAVPWVGAAQEVAWNRTTTTHTPSGSAGVVCRIRQIGVTLGGAFDLALWAVDVS